MWGLCWHVRHLEVRAAELIWSSAAESARVPPLKPSVSNKTKFSSVVPPSRAFLLLTPWEWKCVGCMGGKKSKVLMGTIVLLSLWLCFLGLQGLYSNTEYLEEAWWVSLIPSCSIFPLWRDFGVVSCSVLRKGLSVASLCGEATAVLLKSAACWVIWVCFWMLVFHSHWCFAELVDLSVLAGVDDLTGSGVGMSPSCFAFVCVFGVQSMQLIGSTLAQPLTCLRCRWDSLWGKGVFDEEQQWNKLETQKINTRSYSENKGVIRKILVLWLIQYLWKFFCFFFLLSKIQN